MQTVRVNTTLQNMRHMHSTPLPKSSIEPDIEPETANEIKVLQKANRILQKKLSRSERTRAEMERENQERENMLKRLLLEAEAQSASLTEAKAAADNANSAKSEFLANMSHELRTPLNGILGYAQILKHSDDLSRENQKGVEVISQCGSHLLTLINDILDLSKIEARRMDLHLTEFSLGTFLQGVAEMCQIRATQKNIEFVYEANALLPKSVCADEKRLRQVLINLLGNAIKFTDQGSVLFRVESATNSKHSLLKFSIRDTGVGMTAEQTQRIFQPFEQVGDDSRKAEGTGLGLAISTRIIELMGSELMVRSELGKGSHFSFSMAIGALEVLTDEELALREITSQLGQSVSATVVFSEAKGLNPSALTPTADEKAPSIAELASLQVFAQQGDLDAVLAEAQTLQDRYPQFIQSVITLAEDFRLKALLNLLGKHT
ncbi:MAG: hypothetical protein DCF25_06395 [Leptolyngbya foveolarum]|uniref:Circadian input-output histidine kinase CikA n=1 Tax=Leptolyngbya foveolarum TaxID=47253 RepID=A0A2W4UGZ3_9CYAN|nr:MAG: hypothetical protein DCF25_06395 [Leptolyngbya foveolarum]